MTMLERLTTPILLHGGETIAYRDPAAIYHSGTLHLFFTQVTTEPDGAVFLQLAVSRTTDFLNWSLPQALTSRDASLNYSSPGNIIEHEGRWILCLQTYPRPSGEKWGNASSRIYTMTSVDLESWTEPALLRVKGPSMPVEDMGRMIDPCLFPDKEVPGKWWCSYKQDGVALSWSVDLVDWIWFGRTSAGENSCVLVENSGYILFHSPENGIGVKRSPDLVDWQDEGVFYLGQAGWPWAQGRLTAGFVLDLRRVPGVEKYLLFFHGSGPEDERTMFDTHASIGLAWSDTLENWTWPGKG